MTRKIDILKMFFIGIILVSVLLLSGCTEDNNDSNNDQGTGDADTGGSSNDYSGNHDPRLIGNWTYNNSWVHFHEDGTFHFLYDYVYNFALYEGTWQAKDGQLSWGTNGHEISDWYSMDSYHFNGDDLVITRDSSEITYEKQ